MTVTSHDPSNSQGTSSPVNTEIGPRVILSFDVEEHYRIEAASSLEITPELKAHYAERVGPTIRWLLERLAERDIKATFFIVGELAKNDPGLVREIHNEGHEVASHGWDHRRVLAMSPGEFREDLRRGVDVLQQITGEAVYGYRAPTFSVVRETAWAIDVLADFGLKYDSSIYPIKHDRYGISDAPTSPFLARGSAGGQIVELPPATLRVSRIKLPVGGGGYFRLLPLTLMRWGIQQTIRRGNPPVAMLYFHPWEFDVDQKQLPIRGANRFRTYFGIPRNRRQIERVLSGYSFTKAVEVAQELGSLSSASLSCFQL